MPGGWNGSGVFTRYYGTNTWQNDAANGTLIVADRHDNNDQGMATGIDACLTKNGENTFTGLSGMLRPAVDNSVDLGTSTLRWRRIYLGASTVFQGSTYATTLSAPVTQIANTTVRLPDGSGTLVQRVGTLASNIAMSGAAPINLVASGLDPNLTELIIDFNGVSLSGTDNILIQVGTGGVFTTSNYLTRSSRVLNAAATSSASSTAGIIVLSEAAANVLYGSVTLNKIPEAVGNNEIWTVSGVLMQSTGSANVMVGGRFEFLFAGEELDCVRINVTGTNTFDAGTVTMLGRYG